MTQPDTKAEDEVRQLCTDLVERMVRLLRPKRAMSLSAAELDDLCSGIVGVAEIRLQAHIQKEVGQKLDSIGQPLLTDIKGTPTPEEHQRQIEIIRWYESRIATLKGAPHD